MVYTWRALHVVVYYFTYKITKLVTLKVSTFKYYLKAYNPFIKHVFYTNNYSRRTFNIQYQIN